MINITPLELLYEISITPYRLYYVDEAEAFDSYLKFKYGELEENNESKSKQ